MSPAEALAALSGRGPIPLEDRRALLAALRAEMLRRAPDAITAAAADFGGITGAGTASGRSEMDTLLADVLLVADAAAYARRHLRRWARPRRQGTPYPFWPVSAAITPQPKGVVGIMAPWNYPIQLAFMPLVDAIAAGNRVVVKPSETAPRCAALIAEILHTALGDDIARTVQGDVAVSQDFAAQPWDHLVFTGGTATGRRVMQAASANLTPLTLELGGKCPAIVLAGADLKRVAKDILNAKAVNAGQTCVAPDTVFLIGHSADDFIAAARASGIGALETATINPDRLARLCEGAVMTPLGGLSLAMAGPGHPLHAEEIFGPVLALREWPDLGAAIAAIDRPLAIYLFGATAEEEALVAAGTRSGALVSGRALDYAAFHAVPFGGVGASGFGRRNGRAGFDEFSNLRAVVRHGRFSLSRMFDFPRTGGALKMARRLVGLK
jgi:acyl-CoA reductase-like NAD-dependent aldehyde dehydrogenase